MKNNSNMKVLHLTNDYSGSTVYKNLIGALDDIGVSQIVYTAIRSESLIDKNKIDFKSTHSIIIYSPILSINTRFNYKLKINRILKDIETKIDISKINFIHAHTWYSDGGAAYELHKKYGIPYIITVRNTDLNLFFKYMLHIRTYGLNILKNATKIIFISPVYSERLFNKPIFVNKKKGFEMKSEVIPNGIDTFWIKKVKKRKGKTEKPLQLIYIGNFNRGKNVLSLLKAVRLLNCQGVNCHLHLVGGGGKDGIKILKSIKDDLYFSFHGKVMDKEALEKLFSSSDIFTMPSHNETFGLVYIEALSQGIPVVYTKDEGIFGYYDDTIGEAVNSKEVGSIVKGISRIGLNYSNYSFNPSKIIENHDWNIIAEKYFKIYNE